MEHSEQRLGVDFGRVIHGGTDGDEDTAFLQGGLEEALRTPAVEGTFEVLPELVERFGRRVWIISKCGPVVENKTRLWLDHHDFWERTGVPRANVRFCRRRADKAQHCADLRITHMIDDRLDVHRAIRGLVPFRYLFGAPPEQVPDWVISTPTWTDVRATIRRP